MEAALAPQNVPATTARAPSESEALGLRRRNIWAGAPFRLLAVTVRNLLPVLLCIVCPPTLRTLTVQDVADELATMAGTLDDLLERHTLL
jgi:hypothetical protein